MFSGDIKIGKEEVALRNRLMVLMDDPEETKGPTLKCFDFYDCDVVNLPKTTPVKGVNAQVQWWPRGT